ncbi:hypothetical protein SUDANB95_07895 (plasmid) [Actinosynnema sp. ALI-1.44]
MHTRRCTRNVGDAKRSAAKSVRRRHPRHVRIAGYGLVTIYVVDRKPRSRVNRVTCVNRPDSSPLAGIKALALDDPLGAIDTAHGRAEVARAKERLRRAGFTLTEVKPIDRSMRRDRPVAMFHLVWKGVVWVLLASWDGSLAYRLPIEHFDPKDPFMVVDPDGLPDEATEEERNRLRRVRWTSIGMFLDVVEALLTLPALPEHSYFPSQTSGLKTG